MSKLDFDNISAMQTGVPVASYKKVCLGKIFLRVLNPYTGEVENKIVAGNPSSAPDLEKIIVDVWSDKEKIFFENVNSYHFKAGNLLPYVRDSAQKQGKNYNALPDEELETILEQPFFSLRKVLEKMTTEAAVNRVLLLAKDMDKSERITRAIEKRLSEIQSQ